VFEKHQSFPSFLRPVNMWAEIAACTLEAVIAGCGIKQRLLPGWAWLRGNPRQSQRPALNSSPWAHATERGQPTGGKEAGHSRHWEGAGPGIGRYHTAAFCIQNPPCGTHPPLHNNPEPELTIRLPWGRNLVVPGVGGGSQHSWDQKIPSALSLAWVPHS
jgi:hypothetical protein